MPITQTRMLALVAAAHAYEQSFEGFASIAQALISDHIRGELSLGQLQLMIAQAKQTAEPANEHVKIIAREHEHFRLLSSKNDYARRRLARKRQQVSSSTYSGELPPPTFKPAAAAPPVHAAQSGGNAAPQQNLKPGNMSGYVPPSEQEIQDAKDELFREESDRIRAALHDGTYLEGEDEPAEYESNEEEDEF